MAYTWITPKTDWTASTKFTYEDYNRIRNNLLYINDKINEIYPDKAETLDLGNPKTGYNDNYYPSEFNAFEDALVSFTRIGINVNLGDKKVYKPNNPFILYTDLNRIESCCLAWKNKDLSPTVESAVLSPTTITINEGETQQLTVTVRPSNATYTVTWSSDNTSAATVNSSGLVTGVGLGGYSIIATVKSGGKTFTLTAIGRIEEEGIGSFFIFNNKQYFFDLILFAKGYDTLNRKYGLNFLIPKYRTSSFSGKWNNGQTEPLCWDDYLSSYRDSVEAFLNSNLSVNMRTAFEHYYSYALSVSDDMQHVLYDYYYHNGTYKSSVPYFYLPTMFTFDLSMPENADPLYSAENTVYNKGKLINDEIINGVPLISGTDKGQLIQVRLKNGDNYTIARLLNSKIYSAGIDEVLPLRPILCLEGEDNYWELRIQQQPNPDGSYSIDWTRSSPLRLNQLPLGSVIRDDSGTGRGRV